MRKYCYSPVSNLDQNRACRKAKFSIRGWGLGLGAKMGARPGDVSTVPFAPATVLVPASLSLHEPDRPLVAPNVSLASGRAGCLFPASLPRHLVRQKPEPRAPRAPATGDSATWCGPFAPATLLVPSRLGLRDRPPQRADSRRQQSLTPSVSGRATPLRRPPRRSRPVTFSWVARPGDAARLLSVLRPEAGGERPEPRLCRRKTGSEHCASKRPLREINTEYKDQCPLCCPRELSLGANQFCTVNYE
jgi:hypothetical protein